MSEFDPADYDECLDRSNVECKRCGKNGLHWEEDDDTWRLFYGRYRLHVCDPRRALRDFEVVA